MNDLLGQRMKEQYEHRTRYCIPRRTYTIIRLDGKAFHTYTKGLQKPFDNGLSEDIDRAIISLLPEIQGSVFAYTQSDEISILLTDFATPQTDAWFDGNIQKTCSVSASIMTAQFNRERIHRSLCSLPNAHLCPDDVYITPAYFDSRVFTIPDRTEVMNYFRWRQQDCIRNSVSMVAQANFSHKELNGKSQSDMHEMLHKKGINWATDFTDGQKNGRLIIKKSWSEIVSVPDVKNFKVVPTEVTRTKWDSVGAWVFSKDGGTLLNMIPKYVE